MMRSSGNSVSARRLILETFAALVFLLIFPAMGMAQSTPEPTVMLVGELAEDGFGSSVAMAGDVNEDGWWDYLFSAPGDDDVAVGSGQVYLFYGPLTGAMSAADADASFRGEAIVDGLGRAVAGAGDMNNDGFDDIVITSRSNDGNGRQAGRVYIFYGPIYGTMSASTADAIISGDEFDELGWSVTGAGDVNGDGFDDILVGAWMADMGGQAHVFLGPLYGELGTQDAEATINAAVDFEDLGSSVATGNLNSDNLPDIIVGAPRFPLNGSDTGKVYVFYSPISGTFSANDADIIISGEGINDEFGEAVAAGDLDGDGTDELIAGAHQLFSKKEGKAYVFSNLPVAGTIGAADADAIITGETFEHSGHFGGTLAMVGDINHDGKEDLGVGAPFADGAPGVRGGRAYVFYGPLSGDITAANADAIVIGSKFDIVGTAIAFAQDHNGDGGTELLLGAPQFFPELEYGYAGLYLVEGPTAVPTTGVTPRLDLRSFPSPFHSTTTIHYSLPARGNVEVAIYDVRGRRVTTLLDGESPAGPSSVTWSGSDATGRQLATGLYFVRLRWGSDVETRKLVLIR